MGWDGPMTHLQCLGWQAWLLPDKEEVPDEARMDPDEWDRQMAESRRLAALSNPEATHVTLKKKDAAKTTAADLLRSGISRKK